MRHLGCPATGRMAHSFNKDTHRCKCGRWERGFKPKKESDTPRDECQICERKQALLSDGVLTHHGYKRPGCGFIEGDCFGAGHKPFPATDALETYLGALEGHLERLRDLLENLPNREVFTYSFSRGRGKKLQEWSYAVCRGADEEYKPETSTWVPSFDNLAEREKTRLEREIKNTEMERGRVTKRISLAKEGVLA